MNYLEARTEVLNGKKAKRESWAPCVKIRKAEEADADILNYPHDGLIVQDCDNPCDCVTAIYQQTPEDQLAEDWKLVD